MTNIIKNVLRRYIAPLAVIVFILSLAWTARKNRLMYEAEVKRAEYNASVQMDSVMHYRKLLGQTFADNRVLRLTENELRASNSRLAKQIESVANRRKKPLNGTSVRVEYDTMYVEVPTLDSCYSFYHEDSCISIGLDAGYLSYVMKPLEVTIVQYQKGQEVIASATTSGCGTIVGISSITIEKKKRKCRLFWWSR